MKTRIIHTYIHEDEWFFELTKDQRYMFIWFFTNYRIGHTGIYRVTDNSILFETKSTKAELAEYKRLFEGAGKVFFKDGWVFVVKSALYGGYKGKSNEEAYKKEWEAIPQHIKDYFTNRVSTESQYTVDTTINLNNKSKLETINLNKGYEDFKKKREELRLTKPMPKN